MVTLTHLYRFTLPVFALGMCGVASAQSASPATPRGLPATSATRLDTPAGGTSSAGVTAHPAAIEYSNGLLTVTARDVSLNSILRQISQATGMKISGGVRDDRVFRPSAVLDTLLEGSGSNVLLVSNAASEPAQLILSPRVGGATPPGQFATGNQAADVESDNNVALPARAGGQGVPPPSPVGFRADVPPAANSNSPLNPPLSAPTSNNSDSQAVVFPPVSATSTPATATTSSDVTQQAPGGVKTPQQIFEQLQRLRQQEEQTQPQDNNQ